ncbi:MAG: leucine-rich repeat protein [Anaerovoracaceae bacterium]
MNVKRKKNNLFRYLLVFVLTIAIVMPVNMANRYAWADTADTIESGSCGNNVTYTFDSSTGELTISGTGAMDNYEENNLSPFYWLGDIKTVIISDGVTSIGNYAFYKSSSLTSISIPESVKDIGKYAFSGCSSLTSVSLPSGMTRISSYVFEGCTDLKSVSIPNSITYIDIGAFFNCGSLTGIIIPDGVTGIGTRAFCGCSGLKSIKIPESVIKIDTNAFYGCSGLTSISLPSNLNTIASFTFRGCSSLTTIEIPNGVTSIGTSVFHGCSSLTDITLPSTLTSIGTGAFYGCSSLTSITLPAKLTSIGQSTFNNCSSLTSIEIPYGVSTIGDGAFGQCSSLTDITLPSKLTSIGNSAFFGCSSLESIVIPSGVSTIGDAAFRKCSSLTSISLPSKLTGIEKEVFDECSGLKSIEIPDGVTSIGDSAFNGCSSLTSISLPSKLTSIGNEAFSGCSKLTSITIPNSMTSIGASAFYSCSSLECIYYCGTEEEWQNIDGKDRVPDVPIIYNYHPIVDYTGTQASIPELESKSAGKVVLKAQTVTDETIEYGYRVKDSNSEFTWQDSTCFENLEANTYDFAARVKANDDHKAGTISDVLNLAVYSKPVITYSALTDLAVGTEIKDVVPTLHGGSGGGTYVMEGTLPEGLSFDGATGTFSGTPNAIAGAGSVSVQYTDSEGNVSDRVTVHYAAVAPTANTLELSISDVTYGTEVNPIATTNGNSAKLWYKEANADDETYSTIKPETAGVYTVKAVSEGHATVADKSVTKDFTIKKKELTVTDVTVAKKTYDKTTTATVTAVTFDGLVAEDTLTLNTDYTASGSFNSTAVNEANQVTVDIKLQETETAKNYAITGAPFEKAATIGQKQIDVTSNNATMTKVYDKTTNAGTLNGNLGLTGVEAGDIVTVSGNGTYASADAAKGIQVTFSDLTLSGEDAGNYVLSEASKAFYIGEITKATPNIGSVSYTGPAVYLSTTVASVNANLTRANAEVEGTLALNTSSFTEEGTKAYAYTFVPNDTTNYNNVTGTVEITVNHDDLSKIEYSGTLSKSSYKYGEEFTIDGITVTATFASGSSMDVTGAVTFNSMAAVGQTEIVLSYTSGNVTKTCTVTGITVVKADGTAALSGSADKTYDGEAIDPTKLTITRNNAAGDVTYKFYSSAECTTEVTAVPKDAGEYWIKAVIAASENYTAVTTEAVKVTVSPKVITSSDLEYTGDAITKVYDKTTSCAVTTVSVKDGVLAEGDALAVRGTAVYNSADVKTATKVTFTTEAVTTGNYRLSADQTIDIPAKITALVIVPEIAELSGIVFDGLAKRPVLDVTYGSESLVLNTDYTASYSNNVNAGTAKAVINPVKNGNYTWSEAEKTFTIEKAASPAVEGSSLISKEGSTDTLIGSVSGIPSNSGSITFTVGNPSDTSVMANAEIDDNNNIIITPAADASAGGNATVTVTIKTDNYADATARITLTITDKDVPVLTVSDIHKTYDGNAVDASAIHGTAKVGEETVEGTWSFAPNQNMTSVADSGNKTVIFTPNEDYATCAAAQTTVKVTIAKANVSDKPVIGSVSETGSTLNDISVDVSKISVPGSFTWNDPIDTAVEANKSYGWTYTPDDTVNYEVLTGKATPYAVSFGGGGAVPIVKPSSDPVQSGNTTTANLSESAVSSDGKTTATVDNTLADKLVEMAVENKSTEIVINIESQSGSSASTTEGAEVILPASALKSIADKTDADVVIQTSVAEIRMDNKTAESVASQTAGDENVSIIAEKVKEEGNDVYFELKVVTSSGKVISDFNGGNVSVTVTVPKSLQGKTLVCVYIDDNGYMHKVNGTLNADGTYTFTTDHFSQYALMEAGEAEAAIEAQKAEVKALKLTLRSSQVKTKSGRKAVKLTWKGGEAIQLDGIEIYRSLKKSSGYGKKPLYTTVKSSYLNTSVKTGRRYYYKVRGFVTIDGEKVYTQYSTKAWRNVK